MLIKISGPTFGFGSAPDIGTEIEKNGARYRVIALKPHVGRNGPTTVITWAGRCADCGGPFTITTGLSGIRAMNTRCPDHHRPFSPGTAAAANAKREFQNRRRGRKA